MQCTNKHTKNGERKDKTIKGRTTEEGEGREEK